MGCASLFRRIFVDNFRCLSSFGLEPGQENLLLGSNGTGKSTLLDAIAQLVRVTTEGADVGTDRYEDTPETFSRNSLTRWDRRDQQRLELEVERNQHGIYHYELVIKHEDRPERSLIKSEKVSFEGRPLFAYENGSVHLFKKDGGPGPTFPFRGNRSFLPQIEERPETRDLIWFLDFLRGVLVLRLDSRRVSGVSHEEQTRLVGDGRNFASWFRHLAQESPEKLQPLFAALSNAIPGFKSLKLVSSGRGGRTRDLVMTQEASGRPYELDFSELSDGQRELIILYTLLEGLTAGQGCLFLDEPEAHVGLTEVQPWLVELRDRFSESVQVFVVSHHPEVIDYMAAGSPFWFERPDGGAARARLAPFDRESGLTASTQIANGLNGNAD